jgi:hypothetical protein
MLPTTATTKQLHRLLVLTFRQHSCIAGQREDDRLRIGPDKNLFRISGIPGEEHIICQYILKIQRTVAPFQLKWIVLRQSVGFNQASKPDWAKFCSDKFSSLASSL